MRLSPARRLMYGVSLAFAVIGLLQLFAGFGLMRVPIPVALFFVQHPRAGAALRQRHDRGCSPGSC